MCQYPAVGVWARHVGLVVRTSTFRRQTRAYNAHCYQTPPRTVPWGLRKCMMGVHREQRTLKNPNEHNSCRLAFITPPCAPGPSVVRVSMYCLRIIGEACLYVRRHLPLPQIERLETKLTQADNERSLTMSLVGTLKSAQNDIRGAHAQVSQRWVLYRAVCSRTGLEHEWSSWLETVFGIVRMVLMAFEVFASRWRWRISLYRSLPQGSLLTRMKPTCVHSTVYIHSASIEGCRADSAAWHVRIPHSVCSPPTQLKNQSHGRSL